MCENSDTLHGHGRGAMESTPPAPPHMDTETPCCLAEDTDEGSKGPPRVASYSDMDTRPPLTPDSMMALDMDSQLATHSLGDAAFHMHELLSDLPTLSCESAELGEECCKEETMLSEECASQCPPCPLHIAIGKGQPQMLSPPSDPDLQASSSRGLFMTERDNGHLISLFHYEGGTLADASTGTPLANLEGLTNSEEVSASGWDQGETPTASHCNIEDIAGDLAQQQRPLQDNEQEVRLQPTLSSTLLRSLSLVSGVIRPAHF